MDYTDDSTPTPTTLNNYANAKTISFNKPVSIKFRPALASAVYRVGTGFGYSPTWKKWIDHLYPDVLHYGFKGAFINLGAPVLNLFVNVTFKFYLSFRGAL